VLLKSISKALEFSVPAYAYLIIVAGIVTWFYPFVPAHKASMPAVVVNRRSRWGMLLQFVGFSLLWQGHFWTRTLTLWRLVLCVVLFALATLLSWTSSRALSGHLRADAALGAEHKLVRAGPYALVRNPIYTSMLLVVCAIGIAITGWKLFLAALIVFVIGIEIRVRTEEQLLASRFGEEFQAYKRDVPAYIPFL
jgi:protein-S-isoprenylcysteine O-methyltransferase Ste14